MWRKDLETGMETGDEDNENLLYVQLEHGVYIPPQSINKTQEMIGFKKESGAYDTLILFSIFVPESMRNQGIFTSIVEFLEKRALKNKQHFWVGPLTTDDAVWINKVCSKRGYKFVMPFGFLKLYDPQEN